MTARRIYLWTFVGSLFYGVMAALLSINLPEDVESTFGAIIIWIPAMLFMASTAMVLINLVRDAVAIQSPGQKQHELSGNAEASWIRKHGGHVFLATLMFFAIGLGVYVFLLVGPYL